MINSTIEENLEDALPCFALSKNDSYLMSASGGEISLFIMESFKVMEFRLCLCDLLGVQLVWNSYIIHV